MVGGDRNDPWTTFVDAKNLGRSASDDDFPMGDFRLATKML